jgi:hypothetical protein
MKLKNTSISTKLVTAFSALIVAAVLTVSPAISQAPTACTEDFTSDTNSTIAGFANAVFVHGVTSGWQLASGFPSDSGGHSLWLFAGATDPITFPGQTVTSARVRIFAYGHTFVIFEGTGDTLTTIQPSPVRADQPSHEHSHRR